MSPVCVGRMGPPRKRIKKEEVARLPSNCLYTGVIRFDLKKNAVARCFDHMDDIITRTVEVGGVPWQAKISQFIKRRCYEDETDDEYGHRLYLDFKSMNNPSPLWSIDVDCQIVLVNTDSSKNIVKDIAHTFDHKSIEWTHGVVLWEELQNDEKGFIKDDKFTLIINLSIIRMKGIKFVPSQLDFTDPDESSHDVALLIDGKKVYASKGVLAAHSPVFRTMFHGQFDENDKKEIELKDINRDEFLNMLRVIYPPHQSITDDTVVSLMILGDRFEINELMDFAEKYLLSGSNLEISLKLILSDRYRLIKLQGHCIQELTHSRNRTELQQFKTSAEYNELTDELQTVISTYPLTDHICD